MDDLKAKYLDAIGAAADEATLDALEGDDRVVFRYAHATNGSRRDIAGIVNESGTVLGMMPHPEKACEEILGSTGGLPIFQSIIDSLVTSSAVHR